MAKARKQSALKLYIRYPLEAAGLYLGLLFFRALPVETASNLGGWLGRRVGARLSVSMRARRNLRLAFPENSESERAAIVVGMWDNLGRVAAEYSHLRQITDPASGRVEQVDFERFDPIRAPDKPGILASGHLANWEVMTVVSNRIGMKMTTVVREPNNPLVRNMLERLRGVWGGTRVPKGSRGAKRIVATLKAGGVFGVLIDQKLNEGIAVPFFGQDAMTAPAVAQFALRYGCPIYPNRIERLGAARFRMTCYAPLEIADTGNHEANVRAIMTELNLILESWIRERPAEWFWLHRRWPDGVAPRDH